MFRRKDAFLDHFLLLRRLLSASPKPVRKENKTDVVIRRKGELLFGVAPCVTALKAKRRKIYGIYQKPGSLENRAASKRAGISETDLHRIAEELKADKQWVDGDVLDRLTGHRPHQGIVLDVAPLNPRRMSAEDCNLSVKDRDRYPVWVLLDEVQDPMNFGAILRVSYFLGVERIITSLKNCPLSPTVSKASAGVMEIMPVFSISHLQNFLSSAQEHGWSILGTSGFPSANTATANKPVSEKKQQQLQQKALKTMNCQEYVKNSPVLLIVGNEGHGIHREVEEMCDAMLTIKPQRQLPPTLDSLNVAVATGILLHALQRESQL